MNIFSFLSLLVLGHFVKCRLCELKMKLFLAMAKVGIRRIASSAQVDCDWQLVSMAANKSIKFESERGRSKRRRNGRSKLAKRGGRKKGRKRMMRSKKVEDWKSLLVQQY